MATSNIVIFGGAFNPPTLAHEAIFDALLALPQFDEVWIVPSGDRLDKQIGVSDSVRIEMLQLIKKERFGDDPRLIVTDFELAMPRPTQTHQTVAALTSAYPQHDFWFAFGTDSYASMPKWPHGTTLKKSLQVVLFDRAGQQAPAQKNVLRLAIADHFKDTSSSELRRLLAQRKSVQDHVSEPIANYIATQNVYKTN